MFVIVMSLFITLCLCIFLATIMMDSLKGLYIAIVPSIIIGYGISKMVVEKTLAIGKYYKNMIVAVVIGLLVLIVIDYNFLGYERYVPEVDEVSHVYYTNRHYDIADMTVHFDDNDMYDDYGMLKFDDEASIEMMVQLHKDLINRVEAQKRQYTRINLIYVLKNGEVVQRTYKDYDDYYYASKIYESESYRKMKAQHVADRFESSSRVNVTKLFGDVILEVDEEMITSLRDAYIKDIKEVTYPEKISRDVYAMIRLKGYGGEKLATFNLMPSFEHTKQWLISNGMETMVPTSEGLLKAEIHKFYLAVETKPFIEEVYEFFGDTANMSQISARNSVVVEDPVILEQLFDLGYDYSDSYYSIHYTYEDDTFYSVGLSELPEGVLDK